MLNSYIYIMTGRCDVPYTGVTSALEQRVAQHKEKAVQGFTKRYNLTSLVYYELHDDILTAIAREKQIKGWTRAKKIELIESVNPQWRDLSDDWSIREQRPNPRTGVCPTPDPFAKIRCSARRRGRRSG